MGDFTDRPRCREIWRACARSLAVGVSLIAFLCAIPATATVTSKATTNRAARQAAIQAIPFNELTEATQEKLNDVISRPSMYRRMPVKVVECDPDMYVFLVRYPEVVVNVWQRMGITQVTAKRTGDFSLLTSDGAGTRSNVELVYGTREKHVFYATATYDGPMTKRPLHARCVFLLQSGYLEASPGRTHIASQLDVFIRIDHVGADLAVKALHPLVGRTADINFTESAGFLQQISQAAETNNYGLRRLAAGLTGVDAPVRHYFGVLADNVSRKAAARLASRARDSATGPGGRTANHRPGVAAETPAGRR
jgi:hypothetical protein